MAKKGKGAKHGGMVHSPQRGEYGDTERFSIGNEARDTGLSCEFKTALGDEGLHLEAVETAVFIPSCGHCCSCQACLLYVWSLLSWKGR